MFLVKEDVAHMIFCCIGAKKLRGQESIPIAHKPKATETFTDILKTFKTPLFHLYVKLTFVFENAVLFAEFPSAGEPL
jgi:hypothetical protein